MQPIRTDASESVRRAGTIGRLARRVAIGVGLVTVFLLVPDCKPPAPPATTRRPFVWNQDEFWALLEAEFKSARAMDSNVLRQAIDREAAALRKLLEDVATTNVVPGGPLLAQLEMKIFRLAPWVAAAPGALPVYTDLISQTRTAIKEQSHLWDVRDPATRQWLYRLLYGSRAALEEATLQADPMRVESLIVADQPLQRNAESATNLAPSAPTPNPKVVVRGVEIQSGDILVSRGGAATSALIARGNDYPGNFSHIALAHVDARTHEASIVESHIESGVGITPIERYFQDKKLRILLLRLRSDLPALLADPALPHRASSQARSEVQRRHIPYDFTMNHRDHREQFCSEVAAAAYEPFGIRLWMGLSHLSGRGVTSWLGLLGARHFDTQEPSDLEYDPQLRIVAEWHDSNTLYQDHVDNAIIDVLLEGAERGETLAYNWYLLPLARLSKIYSASLNLFGRVGPIPEGMSATSALRTRRFMARHALIKQRVEAQSRQFQTESGYRPPYWALIKLARLAAAGVP